MIAEGITAEELCVYAMGLLDLSASAKIEEFLQESTEARAELERIRGDLALLAFTAAPVAPRPGLRQRILLEVERDPKPLPAIATLPEATGTNALPMSGETLETDELAIPPLPERSWTGDSYTPSNTRAPSLTEEAGESEMSSTRAGKSAMLLWTGWGLTACLAVAWAVLAFRAHAWKNSVVTAQADLARMQAELKREAANAADAEAVWDIFHSGSARQVLLKGTQTAAFAQISSLPEKGTFILQAANLDPVPAGKTYALWLTPVQPGDVPLLAGLFQPDAKGFAMVAVPSLSPGAAPGNFGITLEDAAGASAPTLPYVLTETP